MTKAGDLAEVEALAEKMRTMRDSGEDGLTSLPYAEVMAQLTQKVTQQLAQHMGESPAQAADPAYSDRMAKLMEDLVEHTGGKTDRTFGAARDAGQEVIPEKGYHSTATATRLQQNRNHLLCAPPRKTHILL